MGEGNLLDINVKLLKISAMYPRVNAKGLDIIVDWLYKLITLMSLYLVVIPCAYELFLNEKPKVTDYTLNIMNTGAYFCSIFTVHFFYSTSQNGQKLVEEMNTRFKYKADGSISDISMGNMDRQTRVISIGFFSLLNSAVLLMASVPLTMKGRTLPIPGAYPFDWKSSPYYELLYTLHVYAQVVVGFVTSTTDLFFMCMVLLTAEQFKVLASNFHSCYYNVLYNYGVHKEKIIEFKNSLKYENIEVSNRILRDIHQNNLTKIINTKDFDRQCVKLLTEYIEHHQMLLNFSMKVENHFWPLITMKVAVSMFYHIFITFAMVTSTDASLAFTLAQYEICALTEILMFAFAGQQLINESENVLTMLFSSPWYLCNKQYKQLVCTILIRCSRRIRLSVGKVFDMSLPTFIVIMKTALSYLAVLRQVTE